jgi:hypothetical protein
MHVIGKVRGAALIALALALCGCKMTLTNRIDVNGDGSAVVHVIMAADDQLYSLAQSQGNGTDPFAKPASAPGWETSRRIGDNGDHVIEATKRAGSLSEIGPTLASFYAGASTSSSSAKSVPGISPASWKFKIDEKPGWSTRLIHVHVDVPKLLPDAKPTGSDSSAQLGESMARTMLATVLTVNTELKLPGRFSPTTASSSRTVASGSRIRSRPRRRSTSSLK